MDMKMTPMPRLTHIFWQAEAARSINSRVGSVRSRRNPMFLASSGKKSSGISNQCRVQKVRERLERTRRKRSPAARISALPKKRDSGCRGRASIRRMA